MKALWTRFCEDRLGRLGLFFILVLIALGIAAPWLPLPDPNAAAPAQKLLGPSSAHWLGTDGLGRDMLARLIFGIRTTLFTSVAAMAATGMIGALCGGLCALGRRTDAAIMRITELFLALPSEVLILAVVGILGPGLENVLLACVAAKWPWYARMMRGFVREAAASDYAAYSRAAGAGFGHMALRVLLPSAAGPFAVLMTLDCAAVMLMLSGLSFLGLGVQPPAAEWGMMLAEARDVMTIHPWQMIPAGALLALTAAAFGFTGDALRDALDMRSELSRRWTARTRRALREAAARAQSIGGRL